MLFHDRHEAAGLLADRLAPYRGRRPLVLGLPRAGVVMAREVAEILGGDVDVLPARETAAGRIAIFVDDGAAGKVQTDAVLRALREAGPARLVVATAVAPAGRVDAFKARADEVVCLAQPRYFGGASRFFMEFPDVSDAEVVDALR